MKHSMIAHCIRLGLVVITLSVPQLYAGIAELKNEFEQLMRNSNLNDAQVNRAREIIRLVTHGNPAAGLRFQTALDRRPEAQAAVARNLNALPAATAPVNLNGGASAPRGFEPRAGDHERRDHEERARAERAEREEQQRREAAEAEAAALHRRHEEERNRQASAQELREERDRLQQEESNWLVPVLMYKH